MRSPQFILIFSLFTSLALSKALASPPSYDDTINNCSQFVDPSVVSGIALGREARRLRQEVKSLLEARGKQRPSKALLDDLLSFARHSQFDPSNHKIPERRYNRSFAQACYRNPDILLGQLKLLSRNASTATLRRRALHRIDDILAMY